MIFLVGNSEHTSGDRRCCECWAGYPQPCQCAGLIHCQFIKESWDNELTLEFSCDNCGKDYKRLEPKSPKKKKFGRNYNWRKG